jgi:hypothetical protein
MDTQIFVISELCEYCIGDCSDTHLQTGSVFNQVCEYFNKVIAGRGMPLVHALTSKRKSMINSRLKEYGSEQMKLMIDKAAASSFLNGSNGWMASFDWIMRPNNFVKVLEGNYDDRKQGTNKDAEQGYYQESADLVQRLNQQRKATNIQ